MAIGIAECLGNGLFSPLTLKEKGLLLGSHSQSTEQSQWVFPSFAFTCDTVITAINYATLSITSGTKRKMHPKFQIWQNESSTYNYIHEISGKPTNGNFNVNTYSGLQWNVQAGDVLGAYQPEAMKSMTYLSFQNRISLLSYVHHGKKRQFDIAEAIPQRNFPLVSIESSGMLWILVCVQNPVKVSIVNACI